MQPRLPPRDPVVGRSAGIAFDCDGVLVDSSGSYDAAILHVTDSLTTEFTGIRLPWKRIGPRLVDALRLTGGFNNDWDTTYALTVLAGVAKGAVGRGGTSRELRRLVGEVSKLRRPLGLRAVEAVVSGCGRGQRSLAAELKAALGYPGNPPRSLLAARFDETYYGSSLYREIYAADAAFHRGRGLIENERVLVSPDTIGSLSAAFSGKMALVTGRTLVATRRTLGGLVGSFDLGASTFVGDLFSRGGPRRRGPDFSKPSPLGLFKAMDAFGRGGLLYVGDSGEDALMAERARRRGRTVKFIAVCGEDKSKVSFFESHGAERTLASVNELPGALGLS